MTLNQHYIWKNMKETVKEVISKCPNCQKNKRHTQKYGHIPIKMGETTPWETLCVDLIGPYEIKSKGKRSTTLLAVTMIDPFTGCFQIKISKWKDQI